MVHRIRNEQRDHRHKSYGNKLFLFKEHSSPQELHSFPTHALPISFERAPSHPERDGRLRRPRRVPDRRHRGLGRPTRGPEDRKSTRLNSSHVETSYAVFCLKKKNNGTQNFASTIR